MKKIVVYVDMDGVLVDWLTAMRLVVGQPESFYDQYIAKPHTLSNESMGALFGGADNFKKLMRARPVEWWVDIPMFPWTEELMSGLKAMYEHVAFLTSPGDNPNSATGKMLWREKYYPDIPIIITRHKQLAASENKFLIDDTLKQITYFMEFGGGTLKWPNQFEILDWSEEKRQSLVPEALRRIEDYRRLHGLER